VIALLTEGVSAPAGEMVLPKIDLSVPTYPDNPIVNAGATQVYDEVNANLKAFDGLGVHLI
jgi:glutaminase